MTETTATGPISGPHQALRELAAGTAKFQTLTGAADETQALTRVYSVAKDETATFPPPDEVDPLGEYPFIVVCETENEVMSLAVGEFGPAEIEFHYHDEIAAEDVAGEREAYVKFCNDVADLKAEMMEASTGGGELFVREIRLTTPAMRTDRDREGTQAYVAVFRVFCGLEG